MLNAEGLMSSDENKGASNNDEVNNNKSMRISLFVFHFSFFTFFLSASIFAQHSQIKAPVQEQRQQTIKINHANTLLHDAKVANGAQRLIGNVVIEDDSTLMYCDSAYVYSNNSFYAYNHVHVKRK